MIKDVLTWLATNADGSQEVNWSVAITSLSSMIISKAGGVTSKTAKMSELAAYIEKRAWHSCISGVYLAQKFSRDGASNHAEMCILAAADALKEEIELMGCASDNCEACAVMLEHAEVPSMNGRGGEQSGWSHPRERLVLGKQRGASWAEQMAELKEVNGKGLSNVKLEYAGSATSDPQGRYEEI